jgi:hypothetical protein
MTVPLAHAADYLGLLMFVPVLLFIVWLMATEGLTRWRERRGGPRPQADPEASSDA